MSRQYIAGAGFSLERFTDNVPQDGRYYILEAGAIAGVFDTPEEAQGAYNGLCLTYWNRMLSSTDLSIRLRAARGLLRRDRRHRSALETLAVHGDPREKSYASASLKRIEQGEPIVV